MAEIEGTFWTGEVGVTDRDIVPDAPAFSLHREPMQIQTTLNNTAFIDDAGVFHIEGSNFQQWLGAGQADTDNVFVTPFGATPINELSMGSFNNTVRIDGDVWTAGLYTGDGTSWTSGYRKVQDGGASKLAYNPTNAVGWIVAGQAFVMGENQFARFTNNDFPSGDILVPYLLTDFSDVKEIILTHRFSCGIIEGEERRLYVCGKNDGGLGVNGGSNVSQFTDTGVTGVIKLLLFEDYSILLLDTGVVMTSGFAGYNGVASATTVFTDIGLTDIVDIFASGSSFYARRADGVIFSWGNNAFDALFQSGLTSNGIFPLGQTFLPDDGAVKFFTGVSAILTDGRPVHPQTSGYPGDPTEYPGLLSSLFASDIHTGRREASYSLTLKSNGALEERSNSPHLDLIQGYTGTPTLEFPSDYAAF